MTEQRWKNRLGEWRERAGLDVDDAAKGLGVSKHIYRRCELGETEPTATMLVNAKRVYRLSYGELLETETVDGDGR